MTYIWSAAGLQLFGGELYKSNHAFKELDLDLFDSNFQIFNFNDMCLAAMTMFLVTITGWIDQVAVACLAVYKSYSLGWFFSMTFWVSFYVGSVLIAFNVFTAFSIDVYCKLQ